MAEKILILGKNGQVGRALAALLGDKAIALVRDEADLSSPDFIAAIHKIHETNRLSAVINAAAYTQVDKAQGEGRELAFKINSEAVFALAAWCAHVELPLVYYSTDYVFDGSGDKPRTEDDPTNPINVYGESKLQGEDTIALSGSPYLIFRTSWVYDAHGKNFFNTMLRLFSEKESLNIVADQIGAPTYAPHLAAATIAALERALRAEKFPSGLYHLCNGGQTSWHGFAQAIFALARSRSDSVRCSQINPIPTRDYPLPAPRPLNSRLDCSRARENLGVALPVWEEGLKNCFEEKYERPGLSDRRPKNHSAETAGG